ncbi:hypothetical protein [Francisella tularensis]|uniref:hypothetical protein n=1 Tax=Francisella tularensis TaxID=263 RepID=UPI00015D7AA7|nr:hypothetical protein [Francisella tularensis]ACD31518.1 conserved hypothetical protein [Francisella tularensis subsp. mediasiatica FSC147]AHH47146.1 hypothetical protein X557_10040 [Francisella tularensis subsp. holarctica PHIT-FT049]ALK93935.1 hypothetical protein ADP75_04350 [Francisella tularensis]AVC43473.1 NHLP leader peptide family natural product precursor [Francisella tularensis subsp. novicida]EDO65520.1 conserved hypothetical protein [Francisella tularensis subsp. holarctica FSC02
MDKNDFEYLLTKRAWEDKEFADLLTSNPYQALAQLGVSIPENIKLKVVQQKKDTLYFTIPAFDKKRSQEKPFQLNQIDIWSSGKMFLWLASAEQKAKLLQLRNSIFTTGANHE